MAIQIFDGTGKGYTAKVTDENQVLTQSETHDLEHHVSRKAGRTFSIQATQDITGNTNILHITNASQTRQIIISELDVEHIDLSGGSALPSSNTYFQISFDTTYDSGGTELIPVNLRRDSGNLSAGVVRKNGTVTGDPVEWKRLYPHINGNPTFYDFRNSLLLGFNDTMQISLVTDHTSGLVSATLFYTEVNIRND